MANTLKKAVIVFPLGIPALERTQLPGELLITGPNGHYFIKKERTTCYSYEYFGSNDLPSGCAHLTKSDTVKMLQERLNKREN